MVKLQRTLKSGPKSVRCLTVPPVSGKLAVSPTSSVNNVSFYKSQKLNENHWNSYSVWEWHLVFICGLTLCTHFATFLVFLFLPCLLLNSYPKISLLLLPPAKNVKWVWVSGQRQVLWGRKNCFKLFFLNSSPFRYSPSLVSHMPFLKSKNTSPLIPCDQLPDHQFLVKIIIFY